MNPYDTNTTPRQRCEQRVLGAIIARPWLWERATASGLDETIMTDAGHQDIVRAMFFVASDMGDQQTATAIARWADAGSLGGVPVAEGLVALELIADQDLGPGRREDVRALAMLLDDIDKLKARDIDAGNQPNARAA